MLKYLIIMIALLAALPALATELPPGPASSNATAHQAQRQIQRQTQRQSAVSHSQASVTNTVNGSNGSGGRSPDVYAPPIATGNSCAVGLSLGGAAVNAGGALGITWESSDCAMREHVRLLRSLGLNDTALELMCNDDKTRRALYSTGHPCARDRNGWVR